MLHQAFNTAQSIYVPKLAWSELSVEAKLRYAGMADYLNMHLAAGEPPQASRVCPRCGSSYTGYPAISREDNVTEICSACGTDEALAPFL